jgi:membrane-bound lytic murein transglycosylase D
MRPVSLQTARLLFAIGTLTFSAACATKVQPAMTPARATSVAQPAQVSTQPAAPVDPVAELIAVSRGHAEAGQRELALGHLEQARVEFNRALEVLLESEYGARFEPRIRAHFDHLVEQISAQEATALAQGDGFTEKRYDAASIDDLLSIKTFLTPTAYTEHAVTNDLQSTAHDIDIPLNARVLSYVELFTGRLKGYLEEALSRSARFLPMIQSVFRAEGLPLDLAYVPLVESAFKPNAVSRARAKGLWQFVQGTALENGLKHDWYIDERAEPEKATRAAAKYLKTLYGMFDDWHLALASYNGGPGRVQRAMKRSGRDDFWTLSASPRYLPRETRDYVPLILAAVVIARNPAQYGLTIRPESQDPTFETVSLSHPVDLRRIAEWAGTPVETIQELNPELRRWTTPIRTDKYELRVPVGTASAIQAQCDALDAAEVAPLNWYTARRGETLVTIARKLKVSRADLAEANYLSARSPVAPGQKLVIPREPTLLLVARSEAPAPVAESRPIVAASNTLTAAPRAENSSGASKLVHRVKRGDTLASIAKLYRTSVASLRTWNHLNGNSIRVGDRLTIYTARGDAD